MLCLHAPSGYGKTTALAQWVADDPRPVVWLTARAGASTADWVVHALVRALREEGLLVEEVTLPPAQDKASWHLTTLPLVEAVLGRVRKRFILVIDDAGALAGSEWDCLVESLASSMASGTQLVLASRDSVPATLWRLQARGQVAVLESNVLAFDADETERVLRAVGLDPASPRLDRLVQRSDGWPVAVYLAAQHARSEPGRSPLAALPGGSGVTGYIREEIVEKLPTDDAEFLAQISVLDVLDAQACDQVASTTGSLARLRGLRSTSQLIAALDGHAEEFRMHRLLADVLSDWLRERQPELWRCAHQRACDVEQQRGDLDAAVHHAKLAADDERLAQLVWSRAPWLLGSGRARVVDQWLDGVDDERRGASCALALATAWVASHTGDMATLDRFSLIAQERSAAVEPRCALDVRLLEATNGPLGIADMEESARAYVVGRPRDDPWQSLSHFLVGVARLLQDDTEGALWALDEGYRVSVALDLPVMAAHTRALQADAALAQDDEHRALRHIRELRSLASRYRMDSIATTASIFTTSAVGYVREGRFADARLEAARALRLTSLMRMFAPWNAVQNRLALAQVNAALGDPDRAAMLFEEARHFHGPSTASPRLDRMFEQTKQRITALSAGLGGASSLTTAEVRILQYLPTHMTFPQIADELFVSRHTVKTQALSAYRKLGVHTRTEAIERARKSGLLPQQ